MAYDPADLRLPTWLLRLLEVLIHLRFPVARNWQMGMTRPGIMLTVALLGVCAAAIYSGNNLLYLCGAMLLSVMIAAITQAVRLLKRLPDLGDTLLPILQAGDVSVLHQEVGLNADMAAAVEISWSNDCGRFNLLVLCSAFVSQLQGRLQPQRRGLFDCKQVQLSTSAPLGLFIVEVIRNQDGEMVVLPAPLAWTAYSGAACYQQSDQHFFREGDEWRDLRNYVPGDPLSRVHWRKAAGNSQLWTVKRFSTAESQTPQALLRVDLRLPAGMADADFEQLLGRAWFWVKEQQQAGAQLFLGQADFDLSDEKEYRHALKALAGATPETEPAAGSGGLLLSLSGG